MDTGTLSSRETTGRPQAGVVESMLKAKPHPELAYRAVLGLLALQKKYGPERLEKACYVALHYNAPDRRFIDNLLRHHRENLELPLSRQGEQHPAYASEHENLRVRATTTDRRNNSMSDNLLNKLTQLKLPAMAGSLIRQRETPQTYDELSFEERLTLLVDDELLSRENSRVARLRKNAGLKYQATPEGLRYPASRGLRAEQMRELLNGTT